VDPRIVLVMHTTSYGAAGFAAACARAGADVVVASDRCHVLDRAWRWPAESMVIDFTDPERAAATIADAARATSQPPVVAVLPVGGELPARVAGDAARRLGLLANAPEAMRAAGNKLVMRERLAADEGLDRDFCQPRFVALPRRADPERAATAIAAPGGVGFPCVLKPLALSGSRGVIRADDHRSFVAAFTRVGRILDTPAIQRLDGDAATQILVESFVPGPEIALEGLMTSGTLEVLAVFDKPDPLDGPFFEETLYVTPSRLPDPAQRHIHRAVTAAARALGIRTGAVHAELRLGGTASAAPVLIEIAARPIGGLCARSLRFSGRPPCGRRPRPPHPRGARERRDDAPDPRTCAFRAARGDRRRRGARGALGR
jgi:biotin carboxylase